MKAIVTTGFKTNTGKVFHPGDIIEAEPEKLKILESRGRVRIEVVTLSPDFICPIDTLKPIDPPPERPLPALPTYREGAKVRYHHMRALNVRRGVIAEVKIHPFGPWYRIKDGDALRWVSENHIGIVTNNGGRHEDC